MQPEGQQPAIFHLLTLAGKMMKAPKKWKKTKHISSVIDHELVQAEEKAKANRSDLAVRTTSSNNS